jgi:hypothetical protein
MEENLPPTTLPRSSARGLAALERLVVLADAIIGSVRVAMFASVAAGLWLWIAIFFPFRLSVITGSLALIILLIAAAPGTIMVLFYLGLQSVRKAPDRISELHRQGMDGLRGVKASMRRDAPHAGGMRHRWQLIRALWEVRGLADEARDMALQYIAIVRLANPIAAMAVAGAIVGTMGLALIAAVVTVVRLV